MTIKTYIIVIALLAVGDCHGYGQAVHLDTAAGAHMSWIRGGAFTTGSIELDIKGKDLFQQSFVGFAFHGVDDTTYEAVYFRPFNFRSTDSLRRGHAVQYIALPLDDWPKLRAEFPNKYEHSIVPAPDPNEWFHVKLMVMAGQISVFVNGEAKPCLVVSPLGHTAGKRMGYWAGNVSAGDWKNLITKPD